MIQRLRRAAQTPAFNKVALVVCALIWGFSFFVMKEATEALPVFWVLAIRFIMAAILTLVVFGKAFFSHLDRKTIAVGLAMGVTEWLGYAFQTVGLTMTTPGKNAFLTGIYVVMVPFLAWMFGLGRPKRYDLVAAVVCVCGMGLVALDGGLSVNPGDALSMVDALFYAIQIVIVSKWGGELDIWALTAWQFIVMGGCSTVCGIFEPAPGLAAFTPTIIGQLVFFGVVCSFAALTVMNYALTKVDPSEGSLLASLESPSGVFFSVMAGYEVLTGQLVAGFALIFLAILVSNGWPWLMRRLGRASKN
jgi:drug/metabolite transporter (DMT)-like permease